MAVPKKKTSKSRRGQRRSHHALDKMNVIVDKDTGEYRLSHMMSPKDGTYNNMTIITKKVKADDEE